ncbi:hypothetical protein [Chitinivibrio alkaliphilus]|uniref:Uncharacterized protein n=1 Tax=Chitinivibrio alkaliphilus ACht1 TaxID=1313304 RepID=U7D7C7_9BACT|nr:hypothetical protein [Chitinivibrio alkaliphilus]ERP31007.1 hypothetical protein CALK_2144 [Chitinivibrio alkaliphilus ACht1]
MAQKQEVVVTDIQMPLSSMIVFMVKWAVATIPAAIILFFLGVFLMTLFGKLGAGM